MRPRPALAGASLLTVLALPASALAAPTIEPLKPCYVTAGTAAQPAGEGVALSAQGFTPTAKVDLAVNGAPIAGGSGLQVGEQGLLQLKPFPAPFVAQGTNDFTVTLTEQGNPANTVSATTKATRLDVTVDPPEARPDELVRFAGRGFTEDKAIYAHYTRRGKQVARVRMARRPGPCGAFSVRRPQFPLRRPARGAWIVQFDQHRPFVDGRRGTLGGVYVRVRFTITLTAAP